MILHFSKYQGTGNDFVLINDLKNAIEISQNSIAKICDRHFGIGADGLMLLRSKAGFDFEMKYYNSDGNESTMCGNGGRCIVAFAKAQGIIEKEARFLAIDGEHIARIEANNQVALGMINVAEINHLNTDYQLFTGSPHYVSFINESPFLQTNFVEKAKSIRNSEPYKNEGINVNFVKSLGESKIEMRTFERGVEDETLSCGTGAVAAAIASHSAFGKEKGFNQIDIKTAGGNLSVSFVYDQNYQQVQLIGPANFVFSGIIEI